MTTTNPLSQIDWTRRGYLHLLTPNIPKHHRKHSYKLGNHSVHLSYEPNDLFIKCTYTEVSYIKGLIYFVNRKVKTFTKFVDDAKDRTLHEITVYFLRFNDTPLYLSIMLRPISTTADNYHLNYKLNKSGEWEEASHYFYIFGDLKSQALKFKMLQYFEIEKIESDYYRDRIGTSHPHIDVYKNKTGDFKFYKHMMEEKLKVLKYFTYKNRLLKDILLLDDEFHEIDVYYHLYDFKNNLPLMIIIHKSDKIREYYINKGGNYKWELDKQSSDYYDDLEKLKERLTTLREELMGPLISLELDYIPNKFIPEQYEDNKDLLCLRQNEGDLKYTSCKFYYEDGRRFSIYELVPTEYKIKFPDLTLYSIQKFYTFHNGSYELPLFLCAVYETHHNEIYDWYELADRKDTRYEISYLLSGDPAKFKDLFDLVRMYEIKHFQLDFEIPLSLPTKDPDNYRPIVGIDGHTFDKHYQNFEINHKKYVLTPKYGNFFTIKSLTFYHEKALEKEFKPVKEVHVFEHANYFHYKVCIVTSNYNYNNMNEDKEYHWYEFRKETNLGDNWKMIGKLSDTKKSPDEYNTNKDIKELMDEMKVRSYDGKQIEVFYKRDAKFAPGLPARPIHPGQLIPKHYETVADDLEEGYHDEEQQEKPGTITPLVGGLIGSGAGVGIVSVTGGYLIYSNMGAISSVFASIWR